MPCCLLPSVSEFQELGGKWGKFEVDPNRAWFDNMGGDVILDAPWSWFV